MDYFNELKDIFSRIKASDSQVSSYSVGAAIAKTVKLILGMQKSGNKVMIIGNGGSAGIAGHIATDLLKNCSIPAMTFHDLSLVTCVSNDLGFEQVFVKPVSVMARKGDILCAISSSGRSKNIEHAVKQARKRGCQVITLSGFSKDNPLRKSGDINFYVPSQSYGFVEIAHLAILHCIVDKIWLG